MSDFNSEDLEKSLYVEIQTYLGERLSGVQSELEQLQNEVREALARVAGKLQPSDDDSPHSTLAAVVAEHIRNAHRRGSEEFAAAVAAARKQELRDVALLKAAVDEIYQQQTHAEILNALMAHAASFAPRICLFIIKSNNAVGWRARGFEPGLDDEQVRQMSIPLSADSPLSEVAQSNAAWSGTLDSHAAATSLIERFGDIKPQQIAVVPLVARDKTVAILYADSGEAAPESVNLEALEMLARVASMTVELRSSAKRQAAQPAPRRPAAATRAASREPQVVASQAAPAPSAPVQAHAEPHVESHAAPSAQTPEQAQAQEEQAQSPAAAFETSQVQSSEAESAPAASSQVESPHAQPPVETAMPHEENQSAEVAPPVAVFEAPAATPVSIPEPAVSDAAPQFAAETHAPSFEQPQPNYAPAPSVETVASGGPQGFAAVPQAAPPTAPLGGRRYGTDIELPIAVSDEERRYHTDARRFARLLVSEIKLYNEQKVREGREAGDLYGRLRDEIERSRQMYDKRVSPQVAARYDYFHHELVNTLAEGNPAKLGAGYPGADVSA